MRQIILSLILVWVAAMPTLNAQQASPNQTTAAQQPSKKATGARSFPQPRVQPTQARTANNNPNRGKRVANAPSHPKPAVHNAGNGKPVANIPGNGNTIVTNGGHGEHTKKDRDSYADAICRYRHERHDCDWWKQHYVIIVLVG